MADSATRGCTRDEGLLVPRSPLAGTDMDLAVPASDKLGAISYLSSTGHTWQ
jgi:hypothetical protein